MTEGKYIGTKVGFCLAEQKLVCFVAEQRLRQARKSNFKTKERHREGQAVGDRQGVAGELALSKCFKCYPYLDTLERADEILPYDVLLPCGLKVDVKTTDLRGGRLFVGTCKKGRDIDLFALMVGKFPGQLEFRGFMAAEEMFRPERLRQLPDGDWVYAATQAELKDLDYFLGKR